MSHVHLSAPDENLQPLTSLECIERAAQRVGLELHRDVTSWVNWKTHHGKWAGDYPLPEGYTEEDLDTVEHVLRFPDYQKSTGTNAYEVGIRRCKKDPSKWILLHDFWSERLRTAMGNDAKDFITYYQLESIRETASQQAGAVYSESEPKRVNGELEIEAFVEIPDVGNQEIAY